MSKQGFCLQGVGDSEQQNVLLIFDSFGMQILRTSAPAVRTSENCLQLAPQDE